MWPVNKEGLSEQRLPRDRVSIGSVAFIGPQAAVLTAGTVVAHHEKFVGSQASKGGFIGITSIGFPIGQGISQSLPDANGIGKLLFMLREIPCIVGDAFGAIINVPLQNEV